MAKEIKYDYDLELDILHVYTKEIAKGVIGCLSIGDFNVDIGNNNKIVGIEVEEASKLLGLNQNILSNPDNVDLIIRKKGNMLFMGIKVNKGTIISSTHVTTNSNRMPLQVCN